ncbi:unnamed protein product [Closterium sp. Yama58-4]|nr:unnamed protein product [Closterium sp. Yama58-4]
MSVRPCDTCITSRVDSAVCHQAALLHRGFRGHDRQFGAPSRPRLPLRNSFQSAPSTAALPSFSAPSATRFLPVRAFRVALAPRPRLPRCSCFLSAPSAQLLLSRPRVPRCSCFPSAPSAVLLLRVRAFRAARASRPRLPRCYCFPSAPYALRFLPVSAFRAEIPCRPRLPQCDSFSSTPSLSLLSRPFVPFLEFPRVPLPSARSRPCLPSQPYPVRGFPLIVSVYTTILNRGSEESRADPGSSGGGGGGAAWTPFRRDLVVLGAAFLALFAAYSAIQNLETSLHPRAGMGAVSLAVIYGGIVVFAPIAPAVIRYLRPQGAMLVGMSGYCAYIAANAVDSSAQLAAAAVRGVPGRERVRAVGGAGAVVGNVVTFLVCQLMALLFPPAPSAPSAPSALATPAAPSPESLPPATVTVLIVTFLLFLALAAALTWRLTDLSEDHPLCCPAPAPLVDGALVGEGIGVTTGEDEEEGGERGDEGEGKALLGSEVVAGRSEEWGAVEESGPAGGAGDGAGSRRSHYPTFAQCGLLCCLSCSVLLSLRHFLSHSASTSAHASPLPPHVLFPSLSKSIRADFTLYVVRPALGVAWIGGVMSVFGVANSLACMAAARLSSGLHSILATLLVGAACQIAVLLCLMLFTPFTAPSWVAFTVVLVQAVLWGMGDAAFQSQINALLPLVFPRDMDASFAHMKMWTSAASSLMFLLSPHLSMPAKAAFLTASCAVSLPLMLAVVHVA